MMNKITFYFISFIISVSFTFCDQTTHDHVRSESPFIRDSLVKHIIVLASDSFQGRKPFTLGETRTLDYLQNQFRSLGLEPGNGNSYLQEVPMVEITPICDPPELEFRRRYSGHGIIVPDRKKTRIRKQLACLETRIRIQSHQRAVISCFLNCSSLCSN